jgi:hypothetical protein
MEGAEKRVSDIPEDLDLDRIVINKFNILNEL